MSNSAYINSINTDTLMNLGFDTYLVNASSNSITLTLPTIISNGIQFIIRRIDINLSNTVTITGQSGELIDSNTLILLKPNNNIRINSFNNAWYTVVGNSKGSEIDIAFNQITGTQTSRPYVLISNSTYTSLGFFKYKGSNYYGINPILLEVVYSIDSDTSTAVNFNVQIQDTTNIEIITTIGPVSQTGNSVTILTASTTIFSNIPSSESIFEISGQINSGTTTARLHSINLILS